MKILVAGGAGYIGSVVIPKLLERNYQVSVVDLFWFGNHLPENIEIIKKNLFDLKECDLQGFDQVIFLAGLSNDPMAEYAPDQNFIFNSAAPAYLSYISKRAGVKRFIYAGSCSVYGYTINEFYDETKPTVSSFPYGISKLQGEVAVMQMVDKNFSVIAFRQGTVNGYSPRMRLDLVVNTMFKCAMADNRVTGNNPSIWRPILSIQDAASAYIRAVEANQLISGIFNIASGNYVMGELADIVKDIVGKRLGKNPILDIRNVQDFRNYKVTTDKAEKVLSFRPQHTVETIVHELCSNVSKFSDFDNPNYYNIKMFRQLDEEVSDVD